MSHHTSCKEQQKLFNIDHPECEQDQRISKFLFRSYIRVLPIVIESL